MPTQTPPYLEAQAFSQLYTHAHLAVYRYIYSLQGGPPAEVEDLTAETFSRAWKARNRFQGNSRAAVGWLLKIAQRLVIDSYRRHKTRGFTLCVDDLELSANGLTPEEHAARAEELGILMALLADLPLEKREMVILRYILGWRVKEIGAHLGIAENTVSVTLKRTLDKLRSRWPQPDKETV